MTSAKACQWPQQNRQLPSQTHRRASFYETNLVTFDQCDQMLKKVAKINPKVVQKEQQFLSKVMSFCKSQKVSKYLGHFCEKICDQELQIIAQSGHIAFDLHCLLAFKGTICKVFEQSHNHESTTLISQVKFLLIGLQRGKPRQTRKIDSKTIPNVGVQTKLLRGIE